MNALKFAGLVAAALTTLAAGGVAHAAPSSTCYINDGYVVSATTDAADFNDVFSIKRKASAAEILPCPLTPEAADLVIGQDEPGYFYEDLLANHLVLSVSTSPIGDVMVIDLRDGKTVLNVSGNYDYTDDEGLHYWLRGEEATPETCDQYEEITALGLSTGLLHAMVLNLDTLESTDTGITDCEAIS